MTTGSTTTGGTTTGSGMTARRTTSATLPGRPRRRHRRRGGELAVTMLSVTVLVVTVLSTSLTASGGATAAPAAALVAPGALRSASAAVPGQVVDDRVQLALLDQRFSIGPNGTLRFVYRVDGDLGLFQLAADEPAPEPASEPAAEPATEPAAEPAADDGTAGTGTTTSGDGAPGEPTPEAVPDTAPEPAPPQLTIEVTNYAPLRTASRLSSTQQLVGPDVPKRVYRDLYDGDDPIDGVQLIDVRPLFAVGDDGTTTLTIEVPTDVVDSEAAKLKLETPGLYPIQVQLKIGPPDDAVEVASHGTIVERLVVDPASAATGRAPIDIAVMAAIGGPVASAPADAQLAATIELADRLDSPITASLPPAAVVAATGDDPALADRLAASFAGDELVADTVRPLDVSSAVAVDRADLFARELVAGEEILLDAIPLADVVRSAWITLQPLSAAGAQQLRDLGFRYLVTDAERYAELVGAPTPDTDRFVEVALPDGGTFPVLLIDPVAAALSPAATEEILADRTAFEWAVATAAGWLQAALPSRVERTRLLSGPDITPPDPTLIVALEALAAGTPSLAFIEGSRVPATTSTQRSPVDPPRLPERAGPSLDARVELLDGAALAVLSVASMLDEDDPRRAEWTTRLDALLSTGVSDGAARTDVEGLLADLDAIKRSVVPPEPFTFTLTGRTGDIELELGNRSDEPLDVIVSLSSPKVEFPQGEQQVTLRPNGETTVIVPVRALANGTSSVDVTVLTPGGEELATDITLTSRVTAFTGLAQVLTGGFLLVLITWWIAHWRAKRREAAADAHRARHPSGGSPPGATGTTDATTTDTTTDTAGADATTGGSSAGGRPDSLPTS